MIHILIIMYQKPVIVNNLLTIFLFLLVQSYDITHMISSIYFKGYASLTKMRKIEWNNR